jgi:RNA polymerase-interacting CarD/CdnL/TRCF family regulator
MFDPGTAIVHNRHGAGIVLETRIMSYGGEKKEYFCMEKADNHTLVMIPMDALDSEEIREARADFEMVERIMRKEPRPLDNNHRVRQAAIEKIIKARQLRHLIATLRDLCWRENIHKLTTADTRLRNQIQTIITNELSLSPDAAMDKVRTRLNVIIAQAIHHHSETQTASI